MSDGCAPRVRRESNALSGAAIFAEHVMALRERRDANIQLVATDEADASVVGFVEVYTPAFLASSLGDAYPERVREKLKPYVASLAVRPDARRRGVATKLMRAAEKRIARGPPPHVLSLEVEEGDAPAESLYRQLGYQLVGRDDNGRRLVGDVFFGRSVRVSKLAFEKQVIAAATAAVAGPEEEGPPPPQLQR